MFLKSSQGADYLVVGLGNPGTRYDNTRHNIGFACVDYICDKTGVKLDKAKFKALYGTWKYKDKKIVLVKPQTFMNLSGEAVGAVARFYKIPPENVIIIYDDVSMAVGKVRIRLKGSAGGHNGIKSIISHIGDVFPRIKLGVGEKPHPEYDLADWVLGKFTDSERKQLAEKFDSAYQAVQLMVDGQSDKAMNLYNR
ncbi:MAG: aminoacyl-tRNA hydrolase [Oscillospiraceae bacterium]|nr:aminoacyl-tRNA hydrolase [Oscillospiraceae bacterium]